MYGDIRMTIRANARSSPWISSTVIGPPSAEVAAQAVDHAVEADPADALTSTTSPSRRRGRQHVEGASASRTGRCGPDPCRRLGTLGDRRRIGADDNEPVDGPSRGLTDDAMARLARLAELEHLAEHRPARPGSPA
jgi:hypothetical protein